MRRRRGARPAARARRPGRVRRAAVQQLRAEAESIAPEARTGSSGQLRGFIMSTQGRAVQQRRKSMAPKRRATARTSTSRSRSPSVQPPPLSPPPLVRARPGTGRTVLDAAGGVLIAMLVAEATVGCWLALPQPADIPALLGSVGSSALTESVPQPSSRATRILFGSCNKLSCDAGRGFGSHRREDNEKGAGKTQAQSAMTVRLEEARLPQQIADSPFPSGQGCVKAAAAAAIWPALLQRAKGADAWLWAGDAVYADVRLSLADGLRLHRDTDSPFQLFREGSIKPNPFVGASPRRLEGLLGLLKEYAPYEKLRATLPPNAVFGAFDDHDLGVNDGGAQYEHRAASQQIFLDFLDEPPESKRRSQDGLYSSHWVGGGNKPSIHLLLLDVRYNQSPAGGPDDAEILGSAQWKWLEQELRRPPPSGVPPAATVVLSTLPVVADRLGVGEGWQHFPQQRTRLLRLLAGSGRPGVVLLSGDIHLAELSLLTCDSVGGGGGLEQVCRNQTLRSLFWRPQVFDKCCVFQQFKHAEGDGLSPRWAVPTPYSVYMYH